MILDWSAKSITIVYNNLLIKGIQSIHKTFLYKLVAVKKVVRLK